MDENELQALVHRPTRSDYEREDPLRDFHVWWSDIVQSDIDGYASVLEDAASEAPLQKHLQEHPILLAQFLRGGHGRWVIPQKRLGAEFVPDFVVGEQNSGGHVWHLVELQSPRSNLFVRSGRNSQQLDEGIRQVLEWRRWLSANRDYARRSRAEQGLGLESIDGNCRGLLLIGRESALDEESRQRRQQLGRDLHIEIHSYDWITRDAQARLNYQLRQAAN
jgi:hypothetical protein